MIDFKYNKNINKFVYDFEYFCGLIFLLIVISIVGWSIYKIKKIIYDPHYFIISHIIISGKLHFTNVSDIHKAINTTGSLSNFFSQDIDTIRRYINNLSWIKKVIVYKQWPNKLNINIIEYQPISYWNDIYMLDSNGVIFVYPLGRCGGLNLPVLYGPEGSELHVLNDYYIFNEIIKSANFKLQSIIINSRNSCKIILHGDIRLELGTKDKIVRLKRFIQIYPIFIQKIKNNNKNVNYFDLRYDSGFAVGWK